MPHLNDRIILRAWRQRGETGRIHYMAAKAGGGERRLYVDEGNALYTVLEGHLQALDYAGPTSGKADDE
ncbi:hypothetical protein ACIBQ2_29405 [Micromonospora sediminimaris]|uniref:hypothetical protein n=1 Tax=Micromonospora sediminimaris TaxID=547162 RepID=UPI0037AFE292